MPDHETIFTLEATPIKFGPGAAADAGWELKRLGVKRALLVTDPGVVATGHPDRVRESIEAEGIDVVVYDGARVEPTLDSFQAAADFARRREGRRLRLGRRRLGIDTAKVADLIVSHPAPVMDYVNPPIGEGRKPPPPLKPHLAIPTTSGTGSEATTVAVLDIPDLKVKSGSRTATCARRRRSSTPSCRHAAGRGDRLDRARRGSATPPSPSSPQPYDRPAAPRVPGRPAALPGRQPGLRRVVGQGAGVRGALSAPRGARSRRHRGARRDDARRLAGRRGLRLGRRAHPARVRLSDRGSSSTNTSRPATRTTTRSSRTATR